MELLLRRRRFRDGGDEFAHHTLLGVTRAAHDREMSRRGGVSGVRGSCGVRLGYPAGENELRLRVAGGDGSGREIRSSGWNDSWRRRVLVVGGGRERMLGRGHW